MSKTVVFSALVSFIDSVSVDTFTVVTPNVVTSVLEASSDPGREGKVHNRRTAVD